MEKKDMPAFPQSCCINENGVYLATDANAHDEQVIGLTKREYFAAMALQGLLANPHPDVINLEDHARAAALHADDLLNELSKPKT
jgi:hypothetical protein